MPSPVRNSPMPRLSRLPRQSCHPIRLAADAERLVSVRPLQLHELPDTDDTHRKVEAVDVETQLEIVGMRPRCYG